MYSKKTIDAKSLIYFMDYMVVDCQFGAKLLANDTTHFKWQHSHKHKNAFYIPVGRIQNIQNYFIYPCLYSMKGLCGG